MVLLPLQFLVARELFRIAYVAQKSKRSLPLIRTQQWYFFFTAVFWLYLRYVPPHAERSQGTCWPKAQLPLGPGSVLGARALVPCLRCMRHQWGARGCQDAPACEGDSPLPWAMQVATQPVQDSWLVEKHDLLCAFLLLLD